MAGRSGKLAGHSQIKTDAFTVHFRQSVEWNRGWLLNGAGVLIRREDVVLLTSKDFSEFF